MSSIFPPGVLFDLDGTLVDSAPDFVATMNQMATKYNWPTVDSSALRAVVSKGSRAMLGAAFPNQSDTQREQLIPEFLDTYEKLLGEYGLPFAGIETLLDLLDEANVPWGIVTNKPEYLAKQVLQKLNWQTRCQSLIGGDTLPTRKPDPAPLLAAANQIGVPAQDVVYVGDDLRDIEAANAAAMKSVAALWGYRLDDENPQDWNATILVNDPVQLLQMDTWPK